ncbi:MAG: ABC transporter permease [Pseudomonadota bacterium]|nr:ABC transporter permease [Pseudomonadota bacterium]
MLFWEMIRVALQSIRANFFRAILTMLGIIIGVAAVITMVALGTGAQTEVNKQISSLGANILNIRTGWGSHRGVSADNKLTIDDLEAIKRDMPSAIAVVPETSGRIQVKLGNQNRNINIIGTTPNFADVQKFELTYGRIFSAAEEAAKKRVIVLGGGVPSLLETDPTMLIGQDLIIKGTSFKILGVLKEKGSFGFTNSDNNAWIPLSTAQYRLTGSEDLDSIGVQLQPGISMENGTMEAERIMRREHQIMPGQKNNFVISDPKLFLTIQQESTQIFSYLLAGIAGISLIVGGIGIMNIMLVTVTERTREIGIRKALGATRNSIMLQFLIEAMALCIVGGIGGIALGTTASNLLASIAGWSTSISLQAIALAFFFSAAIGLIFGMLPARKASLLDPIAALRFE